MLCLFEAGFFFFPADDFEFPDLADEGSLFIL